MSTATSELSILVTMKDQATVAMRQLEGAVGKVAGVAEFTGKAFLAGGAATAAFGALAVKAAAGAQVDMARFDTILKNTAGSTEEARKKILEMANAAVRLGFDDETAAVSIAQLYQRTGDLTKATNLNSLAMDLARAKNMGLDEASKMVGLALSGNAKIMKQYGIEIDENKEPIAALIELQDKLKGSAENYGNTFAGQMDSLKIQVGNLFEQVGDKLLPVLTDLMKKVNDFATNELPKWIEQGEKVYDEIAAYLYPELVKLYDWMDKNIIPVFRQLYENFQSNLIPALGILYDKFMIYIYPSLVKLWETLTTQLSPALLKLWEIIEQKVLPILAPLLAILGGALLLGFIEIINVIAKVITKLVEFVASLLWVITNWELVQIKATEIWNNIKNYLQDIWDGIKLIIVNTNENIKSFLFESWDIIKKNISEAVGNIKSVIAGGFTEAFEIVTNLIIDKARWINEQVNAMINSVKNIPSSVGSKIGGGIQNGISWINPFDDFIFRPGQSPIAFSPNDTVIGMKNPAALGGITINLSGNNFYASKDMARELANQIALEIKKQIKI